MSFSDVHNVVKVLSAVLSYLIVTVCDLLQSILLSLRLAPPRYEVKTNVGKYIQYTRSEMIFSIS